MARRFARYRLAAARRRAARLALLGRPSVRDGISRRSVLRGLTGPTIAMAVRGMMSRFPRAPWPVQAYDYLIAAAWRSGLDDAYGRDV